VSAYRQASDKPDHGRQLQPTVTAWESVMLNGKAVLAIWTSVKPEAQAEFYDWFINEHMPERIDIPGFLRSRRYYTDDMNTRPKGFTFYEVDSMQVLQSPEYFDRLNNPTSWTQKMMGVSTETIRVLARVDTTYGPAMGGTILTIRFDVDTDRLIDRLAEIRPLIERAARSARITGAHLCLGDGVASSVRSAETRHRDDLQPPPRCFAMVEATDPAALAEVMPNDALTSAGAFGPISRGIYRMEFSRAKSVAAS
jgi:hypothetical protein